jgi:hypothetical protein
MSYKSDVWEVERFEKARIFCLIIAVGLLVISIAFDITWMHWPRALAWAAAGAASIYEGKARKRLGRDPDACYLRGVFCVVVGVLCIV